MLATGEHLDGFFDGLTPKPKFTAQNVTAAFEQMAKLGPRCTPRAKWSLLERLLSLVEPPSVRAQQQCYPSNCTGEYWADSTELFGNATDQPDPPSPGKGKGKKDGRNGFAALNVFDQPAAGGNRDGWIDNNDAVFAALRLWRDINHNGVSEAGELSPLAGSSVTAISLDDKESKFTDAFGNQFRYRAKVVREGRGHGRDKWAYDVFLVAAPPGAPGS